MTIAHMIGGPLDGGEYLLNFEGIPPGQYIDYPYAMENCTYVYRSVRPWRSGRHFQLMRLDQVIMVQKK